MSAETTQSTQPAQTVLRVRNLGKEYRLYGSPRQRLKAVLTGRSTHQSHWALREVSFDLQRGQCIGVVGDNGAGKSSLLKLLAGTLRPSTGSIERVGRVTAILELGAGFHPEFSGRDNLYFGGSMIGISREEMARLEPEIIEFSGLAEAMDRPVKTYSSGMAVRLAFALVTAVPPDLLIVDEALAVGDQQFQKKCIERIEAFREQGCTILFCSHSPYHVRTLCDQALWLDHGRMREIGDTEAVLGAYLAHTRLLDVPSAGAAAEGTGAPSALIMPTERLDEVVDPMSADVNAAAAPPQPRQSDDTATILSVDIADLGEGDPPLLDSRDLVATITVRGHGDECPNIGFMIEQSRGVGVTSLATHEEGAMPQQVAPGVWRSVLTFPNLPLHSGQYVISAYLFDRSGLVVYDQWYQFMHFRFIMPTLMPGLVKLPHHWG